MADQLILIKSLNEHCILHFTETLTRDQVQSILTVIPPTVGIKMPRKFGSVQATYLARNIGLQNIIYLAHHSESLLADLLVISLKAGAMICLDSQYESEDDLMKALMGRNKQIWLMFNPNMPHARLRYLASHAPEHFRFMLHPQTDFRHAQIIGREIKQTIELNIHSSTASSLTQHFLLNYQGKIVLEALTDEKKLLDVLRCGHELQILQLPNQLANEHFPTFLEVLPPTGILHFKVVDFPKAQQIAQLVQQFKGDQVLSLEDATPIDFYEMIVSQLPAFNALYMNGYSRIEKLHLAFQVLKSNTIILLSPDIKELHAMAMIEKMGSRKDLFLMFHPAMPQFLLKKLMASMHPTTKVMVHPNSSSFFLQCFRASWNPNCILSSHFLLPIVDSLEFLNQFQNPTQLLIHPQTPPSMVAEYQALMNPQIFYCLSEDLNTEMIHVLAKQQNHELNLSATHDCTEKIIFEFMKHLKQTTTVICHQNIGCLQAALISQYLPDNVCLYLESHLSAEAMIELVKNCRPFHTLVFNPIDKEQYLNTLTALNHLQENVSVLFGPDTSIEYLPNLLARIYQNCFLVFHPQMPDSSISISMKKMSPQLKLLLHPEASLKQALTIALNLNRSKIIYFFPGTSEALIQGINKGVSAHIRFLPYVNRLHSPENALSSEDEKSFGP